MSVFISPYNVGENFESYFVCPEAHREYFESVASILQSNHAAKSAVFCYDSDELSKSIKANLKKSKNVVFVLTSGAVEKAAAEDYDEFRKTYKFVWENNPHSLSLIAINNCHLGYGIDYPEDMQSFKWLHRKKYILSEITADDMADELCIEFRLGYTQSKANKFDKLAKDGRELIEEMNANSQKCLITALVCEVLSVAAILFLYFYSEAEELNMLLSFAILLAIIILPCIALGNLSFAFGHSLYTRIKMYDVSVLFSQFKIRTAKRLSILLGFGMAAGIGYIVFKLIDRTDVMSDAASIALIISIFAVAVVLTTVQLIKVSTLNNIYDGIVETLKARRRIHFVFTAIHLALILTVVILMLFISPKDRKSVV